MYLVKIFVLFGFYIMIVENIDAKNQAVQLNKVQCSEMNSKYIASWDCFKTSLNRNTQLFTVNCSLHQNIVMDSIFIRIVLYYKYTEYKQFLIDQLEDLCGFINGTVKAPLINMLWGEIRTHGTISHSCPFLPNEGIIIKDLGLGDQLYPSAIPAGNWRVDCTVLTKKYTKTLEMVGKVHVFFTTKPKTRGVMSIG